MKYFLDTEFHEYRVKTDNGRYVSTIEPISIGIVAEDGREYYDLCGDFDIEKALQNGWLRQNVLKPIYKENHNEEAHDEFSNERLKYVIQYRGYPSHQIAEKILDFIGEDNEPEFYAYYADYDWVVFCWLFGRMIDLPKHFPMYCRDLKQMLDEKMEKDFLLIGGDKALPIENIKSHPDYPKQENEHNALADAKWNKSLYEFIQNL